MSKSSRWCYTLNNYTSEDEIYLQSVTCKYHVYGREVGESGTRHLQGFITFSGQKRLSGVRKICERAHWEVTKGTSVQAADYCKKDGDWVEFGTPPAQGSRTDLEAFKEVVKTGVLDPKDLREQFSEVWAKYPRFCMDYIHDNLPELEIPFHALREWQQTLNHELNLEPDDRTVKFIVDTAGNKGKSWFAKYYQSLHKDVFIMRPGKHADMAYMLPPKVRVLFLDCTRQQVEYLPYTFLEELKDGYVMSTKYECRNKTYGKMHVVVLMNQFPDMDKLSADRYNVVEI